MPTPRRAPSPRRLRRSGTATIPSCGCANADNVMFPTGRDEAAKSRSAEGRLALLGFVSVKGGFTRPACRASRPRKSAENRQSACKPGSVWREAVSRSARDGHSSGTIVADRLWRPTRATARRRACRPRPACRPYSVLLPAGLAMPGASPSRRCALTAPFHPCRDLRPVKTGSRGGLLSVALSLGSPPPDLIRRRVSVEPGLSSALRQRPSGRLAYLGIGSGDDRVKESPPKGRRPDPSDASGVCRNRLSPRHEFRAGR